MSFKSLLAHVRVGHDNGGVCAVSAQLAGLFDAQVIGISGARLSPPFADAPVDLFEYQEEAAEKSLKELEAAFRQAFRGRDIALSWRSSCDYEMVSDFLAREARAADLIVTEPDPAGLLDKLQETHLGPLALQAGRPVLVAPPGQTELKLNKAVVAWKDTREARRAAADALPLLQKMKDVLVVEACAPHDKEQAAERTADVAAWLKRHGVAARAAAHPGKGSDLERLFAVLRDEKGDLVVAGAYGHSRLREWVFGGVTMDLLLPGDHCALLSC